MSRAVHIAGAAMLALVFCSGAGAQARGGGFAGRSASGGGAAARVMPRGRVTTPSAGASAPGTHVIRRSSPVQIAPDGSIISSSPSFDGSVSFGNENGVPGLGFDYPHLAAISRGFSTNRFGNFARGGHRNRNLITPFFFGGLPYYDYGDPSNYDQSQPDTQQDVQPEAQQQPQQQPQVIVVQPIIQQPPPAPQQSYSAPATPATPQATPASDTSGFVLVRKDGRVLFASAFTVVGTQLRYVTPEGARRTLQITDLDAAATQEMNEARGINIQLHI